MGGGEDVRLGAVAVVGGLGVALAVNLLVHLAVLDWPVVLLDTAHVADLFLVGAPPLVLFYGVYWLATGPIPARHQWSLARWCLGATGAILSMTVLTLVALHVDPLDPVIAHVAYPAAVGVGSVSGLLIGVREARAVQQAQRTAQAEGATQLSEAKREQLEQLTHLLRHDIRNGITVIRGRSELALERTDDAVARDHLESIREQSATIEELIENVRVIVASGHRDSGDAAADVVALIRSEAASLSAAYPDATVEVDAPDSLSVAADDLVGSVFTNLIRNGIVHNDREAPTVWVSARADGGVARVRVSDDGPGLSAAAREHLFEASDATHGVGLYLVRTLAERYGGDVALLDTEGGATFVVELPLADAERTAEPAPPRARARGARRQ